MSDGPSVGTVPEMEGVQEAYDEGSSMGESLARAAEFLATRGFRIAGMLCRRQYVPRFPVGVPIRVLADGDEELMGKDILLFLAPTEPEPELIREP